MPKVSVILPAYNAEKYIAEAIDSILAQTFTDFEFIILNDCSKDQTEQIIRSYTDERIVYVKNEKNLGVAGTLNKGLGLARGVYVARMDADDISLPERLAKQVAFLDQHPNVAVVGTFLERFGEEIPNQFRSFSADAEQMKIDLFFSCALAHPSVMMRRDVITDLGGYNVEYEGLEDYELWCRVAEKYDLSVVPELLFRYRVHGNQVTKNPSEKYVARMRRLKQRQLESLGMPTEGAQAESYYQFCLGKRPEKMDEAIALGQFLDSVIGANRDHCRYDSDKLKAVFRAVMLGATAKLSFAEARAVCKETVLLSSADLVAQRIKRGVKRLLGKQS